MMQDDNDYQVIQEDKYFSAEIYIVENAKESFLNGTYIPAKGSRNVMLFKLDSKATPHKIYLSGSGGEGRWTWKIAGGGKTYYRTRQLPMDSSPVASTPWYHEIGEKVLYPIRVTKKWVPVTADSYDHTYFREISDVPLDRYPWVKYDFIVDEAPNVAMKGRYTPQISYKKNVAHPFYANENGYTLFATVHHYKKWTWNLAGSSRVYINPGPEVVYAETEGVSPETYPQDIEAWKDRVSRKRCHVKITRIEVYDR
ncbi:hypothetical protein [Desulfoluna sp.]|uniref:hypothetical protein n=1 Tax=Desulfoluna sp. TaxID=2045199 RepID=UPI0026393DF9|nr:hypothetical protein [Desulfoluna sp.]